MFRKNESHRQGGLFSAPSLLPDKLRERLEASWAATFYEEVFCRIDEGLFAVLYSEKTSRPNVPVNVLVGLEILKSGFGWSDEELYDHCCFDLQVRYGLGMHHLDEELFEVRSLYNFRRRVREHAAETGENLFAAVMAQVTDEQLTRHQIKTQWQRIDSTQVLSSLAALGRLELIVAVVQKVYALLEDGAPWTERLSFYLTGRAQSVCYRIARAEQDEHFERLGQLLAELAQIGGEAGELARRVLSEQYEVVEGQASLREAASVSPTSLQSPHDEEATYRNKGGKGGKGYVANVSETCSPDNPVQLITHVGVADNQHDDAALLEQSLDEQSERGIEIDEVTTDGGYTGPVGEAACARHEVALRPTRIRGGRGKADRFAWSDYQWELDEVGDPCAVICPEGERADLVEKKLFQAAFTGCDGCPFFGKRCRVVARKTGPTLYVSRRSIEVARQRSGLRAIDRKVRAPVEATVRSLKRGLTGSKLPVRGLIRATMVLCAAALMVNARRLHATEAPGPIGGFFWRSIYAMEALWRHLVLFYPSQKYWGHRSPILAGLR